MTPTNELRFVERWDTDEQTHDTRIVRAYKTVRVLQQKWALPTSTSNTLGPQFLWRDVPLVKDES